MKLSEIRILDKIGHFSDAVGGSGRATLYPQFQVNASDNMAPGVNANNIRIHEKSAGFNIADILAIIRFRD